MATARTGVRQLKCDELTRLGGQLLEGPCWEARAGRLLLVDIKAPAVIMIDWDTGAVGTIATEESVSAIVPRTRGGYVVACRQGVATFDGERLRPIVPIEMTKTWIRTNDAKCDPGGRLWVGTMADDDRPGAGALYRVDPMWGLHLMVPEVDISNGLGWSPDSSRMYYIDSTTRRIDVFDYNVGDGSATKRRALVDTSEFPGLPDGMAVDADGGLWVAFYGGSAVRRFAPDGQLTAVIEVPTPNVTSCAFAGPQLDDLVITTARAEDTGVPSPGGDLYVTRPGVAGLPTEEFAA
ncbi:SMP-30/gluconolactonase/LRE family protein [Phytoactinopolyspora limicola]|uniref:SMP-30/gluconolactonase/LRE family protein n=1 Tax=Phytoactinopolyspora limicola TaxID=2715536 RepID=UPI0014086B94|nr:SMP-30/gluconolactonase/LRE family protein [Phytoactinopolyspora limicola]